MIVRTRRFSELLRLDMEMPNRASIEGPDGLAKFPDFAERYANAQALAVSIAGLPNEPEFGPVKAEALALESRLIGQLRDVAATFEWDCKPCGFYVGRSTARQRSLDAALQAAYSALLEYDGLLGRYDAAGGAVRARKASEATLVAQVAAQQTKEAEARATAAEVIRSTAAAAAATAQTAEISAELGLKKLMESAARPKWVIPVAIGGGAVVLLGVALVAFGGRSK